MPFKSKAQARAAFGGYLGAEMKQKAPEFEDATKGGIKSLPQHVKGNTSGMFPGRRSGDAASPKAMGGMAMRNALKGTRAATTPKKKRS